MKKIIITLLLFLSFSPVFCFAQTETETNDLPNLQDAFNKRQQEVGQYAGYNISSPDLYDIISQIISTALSFIGLIFIVLIIYSGITWMTAGGDESNVTKAKKILKQSIIGLIVVLAAYIISYFIIELFSFLNSPK